MGLLRVSRKFSVSPRHKHEQTLGSPENGRKHVPETISSRPYPDTARTLSERPAIGGSVLIVDSDASVCRVIALVLQEVDCQTYAAHSAEAALQLADVLRPALIIAEVRLPLRSGDEFAQLLRERGHVDARVVLMSAYPRPPAGAEDHFLQKPLRFDRLLDIAREVLIA